MEFNGRKIQVGDTIHLNPLVVTEQLDYGGVKVRCSAGSNRGPAYVDQYNIWSVARVEPGPIAVGEIVRYASHNVEVLCVGETTSFVRIISKPGENGHHLARNEICVSTAGLSRLE